MQSYYSPKGGKRDYHKSGGLSENLDTGKINLSKIDADLFSKVAKQTADTIGSGRNTNKPSQLRKFYDEIVMWDTKCEGKPKEFSQYLPFIRMINAKVAYARGRKLVDDNYVKLIEHCLLQVIDQKTMRNFKIFMEAFMGFYKAVRPKD